MHVNTLFFAYSMLLLPNETIFIKRFCINGQSAAEALQKFRKVKELKIEKVFISTQEIVKFVRRCPYFIKYIVF